jgi:hypothetical protein
MYALLVANNRVASFMTMDELDNGVNTPFSLWLNDSYSEINEGQYRVINYKTYVTKAGKKMGHLVLLDHLGQMIFAMAFPTMYKESFVKCIAGRVAKLELKETSEGGSFFIDKILK